jgi:mannose-6-phosphate isomerase-like protein (cupin superfamily)
MTMAFTENLGGAGSGLANCINVQVVRPPIPADLPEAAHIAALLGKRDVDRFLVHIHADENLARLFQGQHSNEGHSVQAPQTENSMEAVKDASHLYEVERRAEHAARLGFPITELQISSTQKVPWHYHNNVQDTFYVLSGNLRIFLREPKEEVRLGSGETCTVKARCPHLVTNGGDKSATFLVLQGIGEYDFVPLL